MHWRTQATGFLETMAWKSSWKYSQVRSTLKIPPDLRLISLSEEDYDAFCLAYMFTYRDFEGGTLGLAWTGDLKNAGGVCEKNGVSILLSMLQFLKTN